MTLLVPFDGSELSVAALERAREFGEATGAEVLTLAVIPDDAEYARERGWIGPNDDLDPDSVETRLAGRADEIVPGVTLRSERVENVDPVASTTMDVVRTIRRVAAEVDASIVFVGSENAGRVTRPLASVGSPISEDPRYDVHIVRHPD